MYKLETYAQNSEDIIIDNYLRSININSPIFLDIGANDGIFYSNSYLFSKRGCSVYLVEPSETALLRLRENFKDMANVQILPYAIGPVHNKKKFFESGTLINKGDVALVSTFSPVEMARWPEMKYKEIDVEMITFAELYELIGKPKLDVISIDVEGLDLIVLRQIDFKAIQARMVIVENNGKDEMMYWSWMKMFGFRLHHKNGENLIFIR